MNNNSKQVVRDILPPENRSIRNIPLSSKRVPIRQIEEVTEDTPEEDILPEMPRKKKMRPVLWIIGFILLFFVLWSFTVNSALIKVTIKEATHDFDGTFTGSKVSTKTGIPFEIISVSKELSKELTASGEEEVERKASGEIVIFNKYSEKPQTLITNTRFETPLGLIYRIRESITVPGFTKKEGEVIPGQLKVKVYADFPGEEYNVALTDFTVPGFKGKPQFSTIFARSSTPMTGGLIGKVKVVDEKALGSATLELQNSLSSTIRDSVITEVPENFILIPQSLKTNFESLPQKNTGNLVEVREKITASGIILSRKSIEKAIIGKVSETPEEDITVSNIETLTFEFEEIKDMQNLKSFDFKLKGKARLIWNLDEEALKTAIAGHSKSELTLILSNFGAIQEAVSSIKPFWKRNFPKKPENIKIEKSSGAN
ncbi:MAG: hypothetical protein AAB534_01000 [Patescibacteria group bacterium]